MQNMRAPKKAETTHGAQPIQAFLCQQVQASPSSSLPTQPSVSLPLTANQSKSPAERKKAPEKKQL